MRRPFVLTGALVVGCVISDYSIDESLGGADGGAGASGSGVDGAAGSAGTSGAGGSAGTAGVGGSAGAAGNAGVGGGACNPTQCPPGGECMRAVCVLGACDVEPDDQGTPCASVPGGGCDGQGSCAVNDATLSALEVRAGDHVVPIMPVFDPAASDYSAEVGFWGAGVWVTPTVAAPGATVTVDGTAATSGEPVLVALGTTVNAILVEVTAPGGAKSTYTVTLTRRAAPVGAATYLKASDAEANDLFSFSIALSGFTLVTGSRNEDTGANDAGAAYVFQYDGTSWTEQQILRHQHRDVSDSFGIGVDISGDTIVVGAFGDDSAATGVNGDETDDSSLDSGAAWVFVRSGNVWTQQAYLKPSNTDDDDQFGIDVAIDGDTIVVGAWVEDSGATGVGGDDSDNGRLNSGAAYVFVRNGTTWTQQAYLKSSNSDAADLFGWGVDISGNTIVAGAINEDSASPGVNADESDNTAENSGAAYVFVRTGTVWTQQAYLKPSNPGAGDNFGRAIAIDGDTIAVGAEKEGGAGNALPESGAVYVFTRSGTTWTEQQVLKAGNAATTDRFGYKEIGLSGHTLVAGSQFEDSDATGIDGDPGNDNLENSGAAYIFFRGANGVWTQGAYFKGLAPDIDDRLGFSATVDGDLLAVGAYWESSGAKTINGDPTDDSAPLAGAAFASQ